MNRKIARIIVFLLILVSTGCANKSETFSGASSTPAYIISSQNVWDGVRKDNSNIPFYESEEPLPSEVIPENKVLLPLTYNDRVQYFIDFFTKEKRELFAKWLARSQIHVPKIVKILREYDVPEDLAYLPLIESGYNPTAVSPAYAVGPWQFIRSTGKRYGLKINEWVDERMDWEKSTVAAARYLKDLHDMFSDWELALASYNCGEDRVARIIKKRGSRNFWEISNSLPRETQNYVPVYFAALTIAKNPEKYGFNITEPNYPETVKIGVPPKKSLKDIAKLTGVEYKLLQELNPSLIGRVTPPVDREYYLTIPKEFESVFIEKKVQIATLKDSKPRRRGSYIYIVRNGDSLWEIARRHRVTISQLKSVNNLRGNLIRKGQKLVIPARGYRPTTKKRIVRYKVRKGDTLSEIARYHGVSVRTIKRYNNIRGNLIRVGQTLRIPASTRVITHKIRKGDTLWDIASRYRVKVADIKRWNKLNSNILQIGQNIRIYR